MSEPAYTLPTSEDHDGQIWPAQGAWTYEDYVRLPEDGRRYEVIRGSLYVTATPIYDHQYAVQALSYAMQEWVRKHRLGVVLGVPFDIRLPNQIGDPVEPDLVFFRRGNQPRPGDPYFQGVPDLVVHVLTDERYVEFCIGRVGETVTSAVLPGLQVEVEDLFP
jgi:Uma2 family endonuclease